MAISSEAGHVTIFAYSYFFIGGVDVNTYTLFRANEGKGYENIQEGKVIGWKLKLSRYLASMEKNTMIHD